MGTGRHVKVALPVAVRNRLDPTGRYGLRLTLLAISMVLVAVPFSFLLLQVLRKGPVTRIDQSAASGLYSFAEHRPWLQSCLTMISLVGKPLWLAIAVSAGAAYVFWRGRRRLALFLVATVVGGGLVDSAVKILVNRPRPEIDNPLIYAWGKSFPSGHAMSSTVTYGALLLVFAPALKWHARIAAFAATCTLVLAIGISRLMLGVHFISDILAGYVLGLAWLIGSTAMFSIWRKEEGKQPVHPTEGIEPEAAKDLREPLHASH
jgi:membrane-associated phospholipid phosphatase